MAGGRCVPRRIWGSQGSRKVPASCHPKLIACCSGNLGRSLAWPALLPAVSPTTLDPGERGEQSLEQKRKSDGAGGAVCVHPKHPSLSILLQ